MTRAEALPRRGLGHYLEPGERASAGGVMSGQNITPAPRPRRKRESTTSHTSTGAHLEALSGRPSMSADVGRGLRGPGRSGRSGALPGDVLDAAYGRQALDVRQVRQVRRSTR